MFAAESDCHWIISPVRGLIDPYRLTIFLPSRTAFSLITRLPKYIFDQRLLKYISFAKFSEDFKFCKNYNSFIIFPFSLFIKGHHSNLFQLSSWLFVSRRLRFLLKSRKKIYNFPVPFPESLNDLIFFFNIRSCFA